MAYEARPVAQLGARVATLNNAVQRYAPGHCQCRVCATGTVELGIKPQRPARKREEVGSGVGHV